MGKKREKDYVMFRGRKVPKDVPRDLRPFWFPVEVDLPKVTKKRRK